MSPTLGLHYAPHIDPRILHNLERAARTCGLPLEQLELLGQCEMVAIDFVAATIQGDAHSFLANVDWDHLEGLYNSHQITVPQPLVVS